MHRLHDMILVIHDPRGAPMMHRHGPTRRLVTPPPAPDDVGIEPGHHVGIPTRKMTMRKMMVGRQLDIPLPFPLPTPTTATTTTIARNPLLALTPDVAVVLQPEVVVVMHRAPARARRDARLGR